MIFLEISNEQLIKGFMDWELYMDTKENQDVYKSITNGKLTVDGEGDILAETEMGRFWITTEVNICRFNKVGQYSIDFTYSVHANSKHSEVLFYRKR